MHPSDEPEIAAAKKRERDAKRARINDEVQKQMRDPFQRLLVDMIDAAPSVERLEEWARSAPGKWASAVNMIGQLAGYSKETQVTTNVNVVQVNALPDSTLYARLRDAEQRLLEMQKGRGLLAPPPTPAVPRETMHRTIADDQRTVDVDARVVPRETSGDEQPSDDAGAQQ